jgi:hypothetical protein
MRPPTDPHPSPAEPDQELVAFDLAGLLGQLNWFLQLNRLAEFGMTDCDQDPDEIYRRFAKAARGLCKSVRDRDELTEALDRAWKGDSAGETPWDCYVEPEEEFRDLAEQLARSGSDPDIPSVFADVCLQLTRVQAGIIGRLAMILEAHLTERSIRVFRLRRLLDRGVRPEQVGEALTPQFNPLFADPETEENKAKRTEYCSIRNRVDQIIVNLSTEREAHLGLGGPDPDWGSKVRQYWEELGFDGPPPGLETFWAEFQVSHVDRDQRLARHAELIRGIRVHLQNSQTAGAIEPRAAEDGNVFRRDGEDWFVRFEGVEAIFRDWAGLSYIAHLLNHPQEGYTAKEMRAVRSPSQLGPGDATYGGMDRDTLGAEGLVIQDDVGQGPVLDEKGKKYLKNRLS